MSTNNTKEVYFDDYCKRCEYKNDPESSDICNDCLNHPYNYNTHKPVRFRQSHISNKKDQSYEA